MSQGPTNAVGDLEVEDEQKGEAWKAFRGLWVAGTVGGFLAALMRSVPPDLRAITHVPCGLPVYDLTLRHVYMVPCGLFVYDLILRYLYMASFIVYFLLSNLNKDKLEKFEVLFDMIQTLAGFAAAWALGIAVRGEGYPFAESAEAFAWANGAIVIIGLFSLAFFSREEIRKEKKWRNLSELTKLRIGGAVAGAFGIIVTRFDPLGPIQLGLLTGIVAVLARLLWRFGRERIGEIVVPRRA